MANTPAGNAERQQIMRFLLNGALNGIANAHLAGESSSEAESEASEVEPVLTQSQLAADHANLLRTRLDVHDFIASASRGCKRTFHSPCARMRLAFAAAINRCS